MQGCSKRLRIKSLRAAFHANGMRSGRELAIEKFLTELGYRPEHSVREYGVEFDIYLRKQHIAFEFNGIAYHFHKCNHRVKGRMHKEKNYHYNKTKLALLNGILLYHFWDFEKLDEVKLQIKKILNGETLSDSNADKNPSLIAHKDCKLQPRWVFPDKFEMYRPLYPYNIKPLCWDNRAVTVYEYYNAGYLC